MAEPGDDTAAGGHGHLRASYADREQVIGTLKAAFIQGRLTKEELDLRVGQALASRTYGELAALTADLPAGVTVAQPARAPAPKRAQEQEKAAKVAAFASMALGLLLVAVFLGPGSVPDRLVLLAIFFLPVCGLSLGGLFRLHSWLEGRSQGQLPRGPAPGRGGEISQRPASADPGRRLPPAGHGHQRTAEAARRRLPRLLPG